MKCFPFGFGRVSEGSGLKYLMFFKFGSDSGGLEAEILDFPWPKNEFSCLVAVQYRKARCGQYFVPSPGGCPVSFFAFGGASLSLRRGGRSLKTPIIYRNADCGHLEGAGGLPKHAIYDVSCALACFHEI